MILACQKLLGQITKVLGFWETPPPCMGKTPKKSRIFFLTGSLIGVHITIILLADHQNPLISKEFPAVEIQSDRFCFIKKEKFLWVTVLYFDHCHFAGSILVKEVRERCIRTHSELANHHQTSPFSIYFSKLSQIWQFHADFSKITPIKNKKIIQIWMIWMGPLHLPHLFDRPIKEKLAEDKRPRSENFNCSLTAGPGNKANHRVQDNAIQCNACVPIRQLKKVLYWYSFLQCAPTCVSLQG